MDWLQLYKDVSGFLTAHGFTFGQITTITILGVFYFFDFRSFKKSMLGQAREIKNKITDLNNATLEVQSHVSNNGRAKLKPIHPVEKLTWSVAHSPLQLNEKGAKLFTQSGMEEIINKNSDTLLLLLSETAPTTAFDAEKNSFQVIDCFVKENKEIENIFKTFVYNHPVFEGNELSLGDIYYVGSLELRNRYLALHKELI